MADPNDIENGVTDVVDQNAEVDTGINTEADVTSGSDLDAKLDALAGISNAKTTKAPAKESVQGQSNTNTQAKKPGEERYVATEDRQQGNRQSVNPAHTPRAYGKAFKWDTQGNVVLASTGEIIAPIGAARKSFERMLPIISAAQTEADKYRGMYESAAESNAIASKLNLAPEEYAIGARIMATFKADPKKAIAFLVSEAQNNGVDVSDLGVGGGGGLSVQAIRNAVKEIVEEQIKPFSFIAQDRESQLAEQEATNEASNVVNDFLDSTPDAEVHMDSIARIMNAKPGQVSLSEAYWILNAHAHKNGLDWTKPLGPQIAAKLGNTPNKEQPVNNGRRLPDLNGRQNNGTIVERRQTVMAGDASSTDIVKEAMRDAGMIID